MKREELTKTFCDDSKLKNPLVSIVCIHIFKLLNVLRGTGMIASSSTFCPNLRADCQWRTLVPPLNSGANAAPASVLALM